jgi:uncharacterized protein (TIGR02391 family)
MSRHLLEIAGSLENVLSMTPDELAWALVEDMQARAQNPISGMASRENLAGGLLKVATMSSDGRKNQELTDRLNKAGRQAFALLEKWDLAEADPGTNGRNGYMVLTEKGKSATERTDFERIRIRGLLGEEMLHPRLHGQIYGYFTADDLGTAVFEAFKTVEIEVREAGGYSAKEIGKTLMFKAFALGGPLAKAGDDKSDCDALAGLFAGALSRFRNPGAHTRRTFQDVLEAMEELMFASRLLRIVDERRPA